MCKKYIFPFFLFFLFALPSTANAIPGGSGSGFSLELEPTVYTRHYLEGGEISPVLEDEWAFGFQGGWLKAFTIFPSKSVVEFSLGLGVGFYALSFDSGLGIFLSKPSNPLEIKVSLAISGIVYNPLFMDKIYPGASVKSAVTIGFPSRRVSRFFASLGLKYTHFADFDRFISLPVEFGIKFR